MFAPTKATIYSVKETLEFITNISYTSDSQVAQRLGKKAIGKVFREFGQDGLRAFTVVTTPKGLNLKNLSGQCGPISHFLPASAWF